ncbi:rab-GTPase-TBC domain-containing protein [Lentinula lateritia]|uniref:Rab-GTPase-TBC domain-containing protein n=1 Tax=Lentinula aff. lateritia TaxID=2804960 RepID=A0ACC1TPV1_9AGAR|nr:rab-GTPase-TBC domain-containing protein [Lentinula aff. lateritia]KAJ3850072.1 rab-GTPase-TBC domain-containing protein [Lentinula lateritia]
MDYDKTFWQEARRKSLEPGGFGKDRVHYWSKLLNVNDNDIDTEATVIDIETLPVHADEPQIRLDTDRSFVMYPDGDVHCLQESLNKLLVTLFRRHPSLSYFQGYHDIITVLFLTLPSPLHLPCAEKVSLHRTRDAMGDGLEPVLGLLRFLAKLIAAVDVELAKLLECAAPLPYFALSHLLTMFAHDIPTLPVIQHVFDYLLARPPIALVYLTAAVIIARRDELFALEEDEDGDLGMLHSLLGTLPQVSDEAIPEEVAADFRQERQAEAIDAESCRGPSLDPSPSASGAEREVEQSSCNSVVADDTDTDTLAEFEYYEDTETVLNSDVDADEEPLKLLDFVAPFGSSPGRSGISSLPPSSPESSPHLASASDPLPLDSQSLPQSNPPLQSVFSSPSSSSFSIHTPSSSSHATTLPTRDNLSGSPLFETQSHVDDFDPSKKAKKLPTPLSVLLRDADRLLAAYPPYQGYLQELTNMSSSVSLSNSPNVTPNYSSSPINFLDSSLAPVLSSIMGPSSVVYTWFENPAKLPSDTDAELMVRDTSRIVYPCAPSSNEDEDGEDDGECEKDITGDFTKRRTRFGNGRVLRRPELVFSAGAGAVLVIAIALAMYSNRISRGERLSLDRLLGLLGVWGVRGWINR